MGAAKLTENCPLLATGPFVTGDHTTGAFKFVVLTNSAAPADCGQESVATPPERTKLNTGFVSTEMVKACPSVISGTPLSATRTDTLTGPNACSFPGVHENKPLDG